AMPLLRNSSRTRSAAVAAAVVSLEEGGGGVTDRVEGYHLAPALRAARALPAGQPPLPVGALRVGRGNERPQHRRGRPRGEVNVVDEADRAAQRRPIRLRAGA